ncbi:MAG: hypothetical protein QW597_07400 [Thermoplasmataceae archaeon]
MVMYHLKCPLCGHEFDFDYNSMVGISRLGIVMRYGPYSFSVKCPACRKRSRYNVTEEDRIQ